MLVGYARVSNSEQNFNMQIDALEKAGCEKIFQDAVSGVKTEKKALKEVLEFLRPSDTLVVWRLDRLGRSLAQLIEFINLLKARDIAFKSLTEVIDTNSPTGQFFFHITAAFAELERNLIHERIMAGIAAARSRGYKGGRPKALDKKTFQMALRLYQDNKLSVSHICKKLGIARRTFYRYLNSK
jgi:DNA invertase Pin-like site-specific DNA recombinase